MFWLRNKNDNFQLRTFNWGPVYAFKGLSIFLLERHFETKV